MFQMDDGTFDIYYKAKDGTRHYVQATENFRKFTEALEPSSIDDAAWIKDTATVDGQLRLGNLFDVPKVHLDYICQYFNAVNHDAALSGETMRDDAKRFAAIGNRVETTLKVDVKQTKAISDKLVGVFLRISAVRPMVGYMPNWFRTATSSTHLPINGDGQLLRPGNQTTPSR